MKRGIKIGNYVLAELLNTGGMGQVWLAHREFEGGGQMAVAIKFPHAAGVLDPRIREGLLDEARLQMRLQHPNIPRVVDMGVHEGLPYFVMDYIAGCSLAQLLSRLRDIGTPLRFELVAHIAREIGYALRYAHGYHSQGEQLPVIHRDVAPKNVLLSGQGAVYVVDFGVSEAAGIHTSRNFVKGTLLYMAPEHALGFPSMKSDGWGLGAILWEMIEGRQFRGEIEADDLRRAANEGRCGPLTRAGIPETLRFVTEGLLRVDERERLTLDEVLNPLEKGEFPAQRSPLADLLRRRFGPAVHRSGQTLHDFKMPEHLDRTIAAAKVVKDAGPRGLDTWSEEAFATAGVPIVIPVGGTRPIPRAVALDDDDDSTPRFVGRIEHAAGGAPKEVPISEPATPTARDRPAVIGEAEEWRPQRTEHLPRARALGERNEPSPVRTEPVPPPITTQRASAASTPVPWAIETTERVPALALVVPEPAAAVDLAAAVEPPAPLEVRAELEPPPSPPPIGSHALDITAVWGIEPPALAEASAARDHSLPDGPTTPRPPRTTAVHGEMWLDVELDHEAPPSVPSLLPPIAAPMPAPASPSGSIRIEPASGPSKRWAPPLLVAALWLAIGSIVAWAAWWRESDREARHREEAVMGLEDPAPAPAPVDEALASTPAAVPEPAVEIASDPEEVSVAAPPPQAEPEVASTVEPAPTLDSPPEPILTVEPAPDRGSRVEDPPRPSKPKAAPKPARKKAANERPPLPPSAIRISLMVGAPMDIDIDGVHRSLDVSEPVENVKITPGTVPVRWRRPGTAWREKKVVIEPGLDYHVRLEPSGVTFKAVPRKKP